MEFIRTTKGGGAGYARNVGLDHAKGKWLLFADADDLYVENMYDIILPYVESKADMIFFKQKSVLSDDINKTIHRADHLNKYIDHYFETGYDKYVRLRYNPPWGKMIKREFVKKHQFRFDEVVYSNDFYFSVSTGYFAKEIEVADQVLYIYTYRENSLSGIFCSTPKELKVRAEVSFRVEKMFKQLHVDIEQKTSFKLYLKRMFSQDRDLFRYYFYRLPEIYPSIPTVIRSLCSGKGIRFRIKLYSYSLWLWLTKYIS